MTPALALAAALLVTAEPPPPADTEVATPVPPAATPAPALPPPASSTAQSRFDAARSSLLAGDLAGAARGFDEVAADPAAAPSLAGAARVLADTCRELSRRGLVLRPPFSGEPGGPARIDRSGRGELAWFSTIYGIWVADGLGGAAGIEDGRAYLGLTIAGAGTGLGLALGLTRTGPMSRGRAAAIEAATTWASVNAATLSAIGELDAKATIAATIATGVTALAATAAATRTGAPTEGDVSLVSSGGFWGLTAGALSLTFLDSVSGRTAGWFLLLGTDAGLLAGYGLAAKHDLSRGRVLVIDAAGVLGALVGVAVPVFASSENARLYGGCTLAGIAGGLAVGTYLTRDWDRDDASPRTAMAAPFTARLPDGTVVAGLAGRF